MYSFGVFELDPGERLLRRRSVPLPLAPKSCDLLIHLVRSQGRLVTKAEILSVLWPGVTVEEGNVAFQISALRKALGEDGAGWIETVPKYGYRFSAPVTVAATGEPQSASVPVVPAPSARRSWTRIALIPAALAVCLVAAWILLRVRPVAQAVASVVPLVAYPGSQTAAAFSPDGLHLAFTWDGGMRNNWDIYIKRPGTDEPLRWTDTPEEEIGPAWSPDGRSISFVRIVARDSVDVIVKPWPDGPERRVATSLVCGQLPLAPSFFRPVAWHPKGTHLIFSGHGEAGQPCGLSALNLATGLSTVLTKPSAVTHMDTHPAISPDGRQLSFTRGSSWLDCRVYIAELSNDVALTTAPKPLTGDLVAYNSFWLPDSKGIVFAGVISASHSRLALFHLPLDGSGPPQRISSAEDFASLPAVAADGSLAYTRRNDSWVSLWRLELTSDGRKAAGLRELSVSNRIHQMPHHSPDGRSIAFECDRSGSREIWAADVSGSALRQLTYLGGPPAQTPRWSPDGHSVAFAATVNGKQGLYVVPAEGGRSRKVAGTGSNDSRPLWTPDSRFLLFMSDHSGRKELWKTPVEGGDPVRITNGGADVAALSADGKVLFYRKQQESLFAIWSRPTAGRPDVEMVGGLYPSGFVPMDDGAYFAAPAGASFDIGFIDFRTRQQRTVATIPGKFGWGMSVAPDRSHIILTRVQEGQTDIVLLKNWR